MDGPTLEKTASSGDSEEELVCEKFNELWQKVVFHEWFELDHSWIFHSWIFVHESNHRCCFTSVQIGKFHILCSFSYLNLSNQERTFAKNENSMNLHGKFMQVSCTYLARICSFAMESSHCGTLKEIVSLESSIIVSTSSKLPSLSSDTITYRWYTDCIYNMYAVLHRYRNQESTSWRLWNVSSSTRVGRMPPPKKMIYTLPETKIAPENEWLEY